MSSSFLGRGLLLLALAILYLLRLGGTGFVAADEPRYASIGRAMAETGDLITPRLDGSPWFEKPPLLYWTTAAATRLGFRDEWAARLPVALISLAFLWLFFTVLAQAFSYETAFLATAILGTTAGWIAYSFVAVPDLEMSATLGAAMLVALGTKWSQRGWVAGALLGLAILGKAFVPVVLFLPVWAISKGQRVRIAVTAVVVAAPWHLLCWQANGSAWWNEYFWKHHVARFLNSGLEHVQPFWFYLPVLVGFLFPWAPLAALVGLRRTWEDNRVRFLGGWVLFGLVVFSASANKLPGYVLPLLPAVALVLAEGLRKVPRLNWWMAACGMLLILLAPGVTLLPEGLLVGIRRAHGDWASSLLWSVPILVLVYGEFRGASPGRVLEAVAACALAAVLAFGAAKLAIFPALDERVSARVFWKANAAQLEGACLENDVRRDWEYGLNYYAHRALPHCQSSSGKPRIGMAGGRLTLD